MVYGRISNSIDSLEHRRNMTCVLLFYRVRQISFFFFFLENALKKLMNIFKISSFRLIMENNFIQMAASTGHAVAYTIGPIFKDIIDCKQLYFTNGQGRILSFKASIVSGLSA